MGIDSRHRKYQLTINNPGEAWTHEKIRTVLEDLNLKYYCMADEIGKQEQTPHTHLYLVSNKSALRFTTVKNLFPTAHIEAAQGTSAENRAYIRKSGKWAAEKGETSIPGTFEEWGECPIERPGERTDLAILYQYVKDGLSNYEIIEKNPGYMLSLDKIDRVRQTIREQEYRGIFRQITVVYIWGKTGVGKTKSVMEAHGYSSVYRVTDYQHPFDNYMGEEILLLDEYASNFRIRELLNYLDGYPLTLPARYANRVACYTRVYIVSNLCLTKQYVEMKKESPATYEALLRRIQKVRRYIGPGEYREYPTEEYMENPFLQR